MSAVWSVVIAFVFGVIGAVLVIVPKTTLNAVGLGAFSHHMLILIGIIALIVSVAAVYKILIFCICGPKSSSKAPKAKTAGGKKKTKKSTRKVSKKSAKKTSSKKKSKKSKRKK